MPRRPGPAGIREEAGETGWRGASLVMIGGLSGQINHLPMRPLSLLSPLLLVAMAATGADDRLRLADRDTVVIHAAEAWEGEHANTFHIRGNIEISAPDWAVLADAATLEGSLDNPDRIVIEGAPARIRIQLKNDDPIEGSSSRIEYDRARDRLNLAGDAQLLQGGQSISSADIEYLLDRRTYRTSGGKRVRTVVDPDAID
ncbi:MAG: hypothetical protein IT494_09615 [Gammaproteobacteria bacterium]|nr:hypothetical protein [Gammaproteobacteria bacterium]